MHRHVLTAAAVVVCSLVAAGVSEPPRVAAEPAPTDRDVKPHPVRDPDHFAWELFAQLNRPAGKSDGALTWPEGTVQWETWALARKVYANPDAAPTWDDARKADEEAEKRFDAMPLQQFALIEGSPHRDRAKPLTARLDEQSSRAGFVDPATDLDEVRMNRSAFDYVVRNEMFNVEGQEKMFGTRTKVDFPVETVEVKAVWKRIEHGQRGRYHSASLKRGGKDEVWGLIALHITTKDLPNWFWATWEHEDNPQREAVVPSQDRFGAERDAAGTWRGPSKALRDLLAARGVVAKGDADKPSKWHHYVLRGTQIDFTDSFGKPTILANSIIEEGFQETSSCITCHAKASIGAKKRRSNDINRIGIFESESPPRGAIGSPQPNWFGNPLTAPPSTTFWQTDFVWSVFRARRKGTPPPSPVGAAGFGGPAAGGPAAPFAGEWKYRAFRNDPAVKLDGFPAKAAPVDLVKWLGNAVEVFAEKDEQGTPGYIFGQADLDLSQRTIGGPGWSLRLSEPVYHQAATPATLKSIGSIRPDKLTVVTFDAKGEGDLSDWHYRYTGFLIPDWVGGQGQRAAMVGTIMRAKPHGNRPAGEVASWIAVKK